MKPDTACAVVLTYNRLHTLRECLACVKAQTRLPDRILVIDNGSAADTADWLQDQEGIEVVTLQPNRGPAGGMKAGMEAAYERGFDWIWVMDDDSLPDPEALRRLLEVEGRGIGARNSLVLDKDDRKRLVFRLKDYQTIDDVPPLVEGHLMPWNGTLLHREVIRQLGYPRTELFLWGEETEYYYRILKSDRFEVFTVRDSYHFHPRNAGLFYREAWDVHTNWRAYFFIRNKYTVYKSRYRCNRLKAALHYALFCAGMLYYILFVQRDQKGKKAKLLRLAAADGLRQHHHRSLPEIIALLKRL